MARRSAGRSPLSELVARFALATVLDALAFIVWNVGTRAPLQLLRDISASFSHLSSFAAGVVRFAVGVLLLVVAGWILAPAMLTFRTFSLLEMWTLVAALIVEQLLGPDVRSTVVRQLKR